MGATPRRDGEKRVKKVKKKRLTARTLAPFPVTHAIFLSDFSIDFLSSLGNVSYLLSFVGCNDDIDKILV